jgi:DNA primase
MSEKLASYITSLFPEAKRKGDEIIVNCPICYDTKKHLYINVVKKVVHCFRCGYSATVKRFLRENNLLAKSPENFDILDVLDSGFVSLAKKESEQKNVSLPEFMSFLNISDASWLGRIAIQYLKSRGITNEQMRKYKIGYCYSGKYAGRVIVPIFMFGELVYWIARIIEHPTVRLQVAKYPDRKVLNPPVPKKNVLFNYDAAKLSDEVVVCEGVFDALAVENVGQCAVALLGKEITDEQAMLLTALNCERITVCLDADAYENALLVAEKLDRFGNRVFVARLKEGDPNSLLATSREELLDAITNASEFKIEMFLEK